MAFKSRAVSSFNVRQGKKDNLVVLEDKGNYGQKSGIHVQFATNVAFETALGGLAPHLVGAINKYSGPAGKGVDDAANSFTATSADISSAVSATYTVKFSKPGDIAVDGKSAKIAFGKIVSPSKVDDIAAIVKAWDFATDAGVKITGAVVTVGYQMTI